MVKMAILVDSKTITQVFILIGACSSSGICSQTRIRPELDFYSLRLFVAVYIGNICNKNVVKKRKKKGIEHRISFEI